jgi:hypothetical protein
MAAEAQILLPFNSSACPETKVSLMPVYSVYRVADYPENRRKENILFDTVDGP